MKIFALTNDNHMLDDLPDDYCQVYAGELDIRRWGHLSALYEVVKKRVDEDVIGVTLDGRMFDMQVEEQRMNVESAIKNRLTEVDIIAGSMFSFDEVVASQFSGCHMPSCLFCVYEAIYNIYPQYEDAFFQVMAGRTLHVHNTFVTESRIFYDYMKWLFDILFYAERSISQSSQKFIIAYLSERLLDVYAQYNGLVVKEVPCTVLK